MEEPEQTGGLTPGAFGAGVVGSVLVVGIIGGIAALIRGRGANGSIALAYYFVGSIIFLVGSFPTGGFSLVRGKKTRRRPTGGGAFAVPSMLLGAVLLGVGVAVDLTHPF